MPSAARNLGLLKEKEESRRILIPLRPIRSDITSVP